MSHDATFASIGHRQGGAPSHPPRRRSPEGGAHATNTVTEKNGKPLTESDPPAQAAFARIDALFAEDQKKLGRRCRPFRETVSGKSYWKVLAGRGAAPGPALGGVLEWTMPPPFG